VYNSIGHHPGGCLQ